jgi:hypothetical protein
MMRIVTQHGPLTLTEKFRGSQYQERPAGKREPAQWSNAYRD